MQGVGAGLVGAAVMVEVGVVQKRRYQKRDAAKQVPSDAKARELTIANMHEFVDEQHRAIVEQRRHQEPYDPNRPMPGGIGNRQPWVLHQREA